MTHHVTPEGMAKPVRELTPAQLRAHINELGGCSSASSADASRYVALMTEMERRLTEHAALESQLTAARRSFAELRAWVEGQANGLRGEAANYFRHHHEAGTARCLAGAEAMERVLHRLTEPSPAAPADDAKETP